MMLLTLLTLPASIVATAFAAASSPGLDSGRYQERLHLKPLPGETLYAGFEFTATTPLSSYEAQHSRYFPRSLAQILRYTHTAELHLRFALGRWDDEYWGRRPRSGSREGGNGVELWAWLEADDTGSAEARWADLVNSLSGLFCASLNFIDSGRTIRPVLSFEPEGTLDQWQDAQRNITGERNGRLKLLHGMLPHEVVCTENLTPFLKLVPCKGKAGISSLLDGHRVFDANWQTMSIDVRPRCGEDGACEVEIQQSVDMVLDIQRSMRPRDNPIPRPPPVEEISCDQDKPYNSPDTCYPKSPEGETGWSLSKIFGRAIKGSCPLSPPDWYDVSLETPKDRTINVSPEASQEEIRQTTGPSSDVSHLYRLSEGKDFDLSLPQETVEHFRSSAQPPLYASRQITGYGAERGGMHATLTNPHPYPQRIVYLESLPWFLRPFIHTLQVSGGKIERMYYTPLLDRERGTHLELLVQVPPNSTVELTYDFEKAILRYTEYPPDANRGFDVAPAVIRVLPGDDDGSVDAPPLHADVDPQRARGYYLRTTSLLLPLPTPDFSMPYNVIILTSTVIALGFGSIFNLLVRRFVLLEEVPTSPVVLMLRGAIGRVRERFSKAKGATQAVATQMVNDGTKLDKDAKAASEHATVKESRKDK